MQAISGIQKYLATMSSMVIAGATYTPVQLEALLQAYATTVTALSLQHAQLHTSVVNAKAQATQVDELLTALETFVVSMFGRNAEQITEFGFTPHKVTVLTAAEKAAAKAKAAATRKAKKAALAALGEPPAQAAVPPVTNGSPAKS
jgi:poly-gamma-glutamate capsule biosynthesis protein CapA/YwtB (metallophosphatase superfamily)